MIKNGEYIPERVNITSDLRVAPMGEFLKYDEVYEMHELKCNDPARISVIEIGKLWGPT